MRVLMFSLCIALIGPLVGCAKRDTAYHFRGPGVASVRTPELAPRRSPAPSNHDTAAIPARIATTNVATTGGGSSHRTASTGNAVDTTDIDAPETETNTKTKTRPVTTTVETQPMSLADTLRDMVGERHGKKTRDVEIALAALTAIGTQLDDQLAAVTTSSELVAVAEDRDAMGDGATPLLGDLIVLHDSASDDPVIAIVIGIDSRGTVELLHLTRRIVRRSYLTLDIPNKKRDADGVVLNTLIRHKEGSVPRGTKYLAGQLFAGHIRLDKLVER